MNGTKGPVQDIVTDPEYMDVELPAGKTFTHIVKEHHTVFAYVIDGEAYFDHIRMPFAHDAVGDNYFDMSSPCPCGDGSLVLYKKGAIILRSPQINIQCVFYLFRANPLMSLLHGMVPL